MGIKSRLISACLSNLYLRDRLIRREYKENNQEMLRWIEIFRSIDSITDINVLSKALLEYSAKKRENYYFCVGQESLLYGHADALYTYAGKALQKPLYFPKIEHGINFYESPDVFRESYPVPNYIFQGKYKVDIAEKMGVKAPLHCIGPYIHYAENAYSTQQIEDFKSHAGRTLLVFPSHTYELSQNQYDMKRFVENVVGTYGREYNTILVCAYWLDLDSDVYKLFASYGAKIVSAGVRFDPAFIRRLKTVIALSDTVLVNDIGTNIGYSLYMGKKVIMMPDNLNLKDDSMKSGRLKTTYESNYQSFSEAFSGENIESQQYLYRKFWGGEDLLRTPVQIGEMINRSETQIKHSLGMIRG